MVQFCDECVPLAQICSFSSHLKLGHCICHWNAIRVLCHYLLAKLFEHFSTKCDRLKKHHTFQWPSWVFRLWYGKQGDCSKLNQSLSLKKWSDFRRQSSSLKMTHTNDRYKMWCPLKWNSMTEDSRLLWVLIQWFHIQYIPLLVMKT